MMSKTFVHSTCCLIVLLTICIDQGKGNWKKKYRENLKEDIAKFEEMAEKIEDRIEDFYEEYAEKWPKDEYFTHEHEPTSYYDSHSRDSLKSNKNKLRLPKILSGDNTNNLTKNVIPLIPKTSFSEKATPKLDEMKETSSIEKANLEGRKWPKFEDILFDMGRQYDWKNDRWIKVKKKENHTNEPNHINSHEKHKFSYKTVKLNRGKSRRNVVIAVTAVR